MVELSKTDKRVREARRELDQYLAEQKVKSTIRKSTIAKVENCVKASYAIYNTEDSDDEGEEVVCSPEEEVKSVSTRSTGRFSLCGYI